MEFDLLPLNLKAKYIKSAVQTIIERESELKTFEKYNCLGVPEFSGTPILTPTLGGAFIQFSLVLGTDENAEKLVAHVCLGAPYLTTLYSAVEEFVHKLDDTISFARQRHEDSKYYSRLRTVLLIALNSPEIEIAIYRLQEKAIREYERKLGGETPRVFDCELVNTAYSDTEKFFRDDEWKRFLALAPSVVSRWYGMNMVDKDKVAFDFSSHNTTHQLAGFVSSLDLSSALEHKKEKVGLASPEDVARALKAESTHSFKITVTKQGDYLSDTFCLRSSVTEKSCTLRSVGFPEYECLVIALYALASFVTKFRLKFDSFYMSESFKLGFSILEDVVGWIDDKEQMSAECKKQQEERVSALPFVKSGRKVPVAGEIYRDFEGKYYKIICVCKYRDPFSESDPEKDLVICQSIMYFRTRTGDEGLDIRIRPDHDHDPCAIPLWLFLSEVDYGDDPDADQRQKFRFKRELGVAETNW